MNVGETKTCPICLGRGQIKHYIAPQAGCQNFIKYPCDNCGGYGRVV